QLIRIAASIRHWTNRNSTVEEPYQEKAEDFRKAAIDFQIVRQPKEEAAQSHVGILNTLDPTTTLIRYSDGSLMEGRAGAGGEVRFQNQVRQFTVPMGSHCEVFDTELEGVVQALENAKTMFENGNKFKHI